MATPVRRTMRFWKPRQDTPLELATALVAAAQKLKAGQVAVRKYGGEGTSLCEGWQVEAWEHYDECGQLRYMINLAADMMSRARLYLTKLDENGVPIEDPETAVSAQLPAVFGGPTMQKQLLHDFGIQLGVVGDCYLVGEQELQADTTGALRPTGRERWIVLSLEEFYEDAQGNWVIDGGREKRTIPVAAQDSVTVLRVWKPHPRRHDLADSQVKSNRRPLRILGRLSKYVTSILDSRLAGPGILLMPKELSFAQPEDNVKPGGGATSFLQALTDTMTTAIQDPDSVASVVPILVQGPAEHLKEARLLSFATQLTENLSQLEQDTIKSLALGVDAPPEMLLGLSDTNHWSAWQLEEATIKYVAEPWLELVCAALTEQFLWPILEDQNVGDPRDWLIWYDSSEMSNRPDRSGEAQAVFGVGELSGDALRRENGFGDEDAPTEAEREYRSLLDVASKIPSIAAQIAPRLLQALGAVAAGMDQVPGPALDTSKPEPPPAPVAAPPPPPADGQPPPADQPANGPPERQPQSQQQAIAAEGHCSAEDPRYVAAVERVAVAALRRANNRNVGRAKHSAELKNVAPERLHLRVPVLPELLHRLLEGAFEDVPALADRLYEDPAVLDSALRSYVTVTLTAGLEPSADRLRECLAVAVCGADPG